MAVVLEVLLGLAVIVIGFPVALFPGWLFARLVFRLTDRETDGYITDGLAGTVALTLLAMALGLSHEIGTRILN